MKTGICMKYFLHDFRLSSTRFLKYIYVMVTEICNDILFAVNYFIIMKQEQYHFARENFCSSERA